MELRLQLPPQAQLRPPPLRGRRKRKSETVPGDSYPPDKEKGDRKVLFFLEIGFFAMPRARCGIEAALLEYLRRKGIAKGVALAVAYSGGPDSTALLAALAAIGWSRIIALHVDHGLRPRDELDTELALVKNTCSSLGVPLLIARVAPGAITRQAKERGEGIEAEARRYRYIALRGGMERSGAAAVLFAHTRDDQSETILMRLLGGSGAEGLKGIPEASGPFLRPFLCLAKSELLSYLEERGISYSIDSTNASGDYLRNRIRRNLVPILDSGFPGWRRGLSRSAAKAARDEAALASAAAELAFSPLAGEKDTLWTDAAPFLAAPEAVALRALIRAGGSISGKERFPEDVALAAIESLRRGFESVYRGAGLEIMRHANLVLLKTFSIYGSHGGLDFPRRDGYFVVIDRPRRVSVGGLEVEASWHEDSESGIRADAFRFPLVVRSRRPGDAIAQKDGTKRLDALFSEWALPEGARGSAPVVEDREGIVAVLASGFGGKDRFRTGPSGTCACRLSIMVKGA
jgi:tRNA(Ile)-lysidine synthase